jgi:hypothetical protein
MKKVTVINIRPATTAGQPAKPVKAHPEVEKFCNDFKLYMKENPTEQKVFLTAIEQGDFKKFKRIVDDFIEPLFDHEEYDNKL